MDAADIELNPQRDAAGLGILSLADDLELGVQGCFWLKMEPDQPWQLHLVTPLVDEKGPRWIYERLMKVFAKVAMPSAITPLDVFVTSPETAVFQALAPIHEMAGEVPVNIANSVVGDFPLYALRLYRAKRSVSARPRKFDMKVRRLLAA